MDANLSIKNQQRVLKTHPNATVVRSRSEWLKSGRSIIPGAQPAWILAPIAWNRAGDPVAFKECPVYDIAATEPIETLDESVA